MKNNAWLLLTLSAALGAGATAAYADGRELLLSGPAEQVDRGIDTVTVLGQKIKGSVDQINVGEIVNVYGKLGQDGTITDSVIQSTGKFGTNGDTVFLKGVITNADPALGQVEIDGITINYTAELANSEFAMPAVGDIIAVAGTEPATKGVLVTAGTGLAAYALGGSADGFSSLPGTIVSGIRAAGIVGSGINSSGIVGSGINSSGIVGSGINSSGIVGSGINSSGIVGSGINSSGIVGSGVNSSGIVGSGINSAGIVGSGISSAGLVGSGHAGR